MYRFRDARGRVIYVGKAKSLRQRLNSYFADFASLHPRTQAMLTSAASVDWTVVSTEVEALQLEYSWIKEFDPRYNVKYRDDKSYPLPCPVSTAEQVNACVVPAARSSVRSSLLPACAASSVTVVSMPRGTISPPSMVSSKNCRNRGMSQVDARIRCFS